jgi:hypothetical protein
MLRGLASSLAFLSPERQVAVYLNSLRLVTLDTEALLLEHPGRVAVVREVLGSKPGIFLGVPGGGAHGLDRGEVLLGTVLADPEVPVVGHAVGGVVVEVLSPLVFPEQVPDRPPGFDDLAPLSLTYMFGRQGDAPGLEVVPELLLYLLYGPYPPLSGSIVALATSLIVLIECRLQTLDLYPWPFFPPQPPP